jgi:hypothetical protein
MSIYTVLYKFKKKKTEFMSTLAHITTGYSPTLRLREEQVKILATLSAGTTKVSHSLPQLE